ncbi:MAG: DNA-deoxyinosine glycosylase [Candidatus Saccharibacteria bacterium]|nr:DNA-deoxyinosine glycosylase [Moraxellaceae bacterium]
MARIDADELAYSFRPVINDSARVIILGSMPGIKSLNEQQYYAHPQNAFWRIMAMLFDFDVDAEYEDRLGYLQTSGVALWDVLHSCKREGSLDSMIQPQTQVANDFYALFQKYPNVRAVFFNGAKAESFFKRHILPSLAERQLHFARLPSTSPAHASLSFDAKLEAWRVICHVR